MDIKMMDSHKLIYHPDRVVAWLKGENVYPINMEVCLAGACNHRCVFCCCDYLKYKPNYLEKDVLLKNFREMYQLGLRSVLFAGTGEPLLHPNFIEIVNETKKIGIDVALSTNGVLFTKDIAEQCLESFSWIRFSSSAGTEENYHKIHRGKPGDFARVISNIKDASEIKKKNGCGVNIGVQIVLVHENYKEVLTLGEIVRDAGADMFYVKAYGINMEMENEIINEDSKFSISDIMSLSEAVSKLSNENFKADFRIQRFEHLASERPYKECYAAPFHAFLASDGNIYPCCHTVGMDKLSLGNIYQESIKQIWNSDKRVEKMKYVKDCNLSMCPRACKLDVMNRYLMQLTHPDNSVNFI